MLITSKILPMLAIASACFLAIADGGKDFKFKNPKEDIKLNAAPGDEIEIELVENATTGFMWHADFDKSLCKVEIDHEGPEKSKEALCGAPGKAEIDIEPLFAKPMAVVLEYKRAWEKDVEPAQRICVLINGATAPSKNKGNGMLKIDELLSKAGYFFLATVDGDQPKLRPLGAHFIADGKVIFGVGDFKNVYKQLAKNPKTEIVAMVDGKGKWLRYTGKAVFAEGADRVRYQEMTFEHIPGLKDIYNEKTGHKLMCFWLEDATAEVINMMPPGETIELK